MKKYDVVVDLTAVAHKVIELEDNKDIEEYLDSMQISDWYRADIEFTYIDAYEWKEID